ncbi:MAG: endonuclease [Clostridiales bacterium]|nr:endonuclease [Clostridiales bacterium]
MSNFSIQKICKKILIFLCVLILILLVIVLGFLGYLKITEYNPKKIENLKVENKEKETKDDKNNNYELNKEYKLLSWNVGFFGMDKNIDFFMDGGKMVFPISQKQVEENISKAIEEIKKENPDIINLQEVDKYSKRTGFMDQVKILNEKFKQNSIFAYNMKVKFVPYPIPPLGQMETGIYSSSKKEILNPERHQLPIAFKYPVRLSNFKRAFTVSYSNINGSDKKLVLLNAHLDAYDDEKSGFKKKQTEEILNFMKKEREKGNYVILSADFNQNLKMLNKDEMEKIPSNLWRASNFDTELLSDKFKLLHPNKNTARLNNKPYKKGSENTYYYIIDGFVVSDNIKVNEIKVNDLDFQNSDHNPVVLKFELIKK